MLRLMFLVSSLALAACTPHSPSHSRATHHPAPPAAPKKPLVKKALGLQAQPVQSVQPRPVRPLAYHRTSSQGVTLAMVCFDDREYQLRVADQPDGCGSRWMDARSAAGSYRGLAAINGGFFTPEGKPLGLLMETGTSRGHINQSSLGAGMFISSKTASAIIRRERYSSSRLAAEAYNLLQTGPMLVERGQPVTGLSKANHRPRSFIAWDGGHHWAIGHAQSTTLAALAKALANTSPKGFNINTALNLDGGRSSDLWVGPEVPNGNQTHRSFLNKPVRNYLVLIPR